MGLWYTHSLIMIKPTITISDFAKLDFRIGKITQAEEVEGSNKLQRLTVDFGEEIGTRNILAGIRAFYTTKQLIGKTLLFLVNLSPKKMLNEESQGMIVCADIDGRPIFLVPEEEIKPGTIVR